MNENQCSLFDMETEPPEAEKSPLNGACVTGLSPSGHCGAAAALRLLRRLLQGLQSPLWLAENGKGK